MSLDFDLTEIPDYENVCYYPDGQMNVVTNAIIFAMMGTHTGGEITAKNAEEVFVRISILERIHGPYLTMKGGEPRPITLADVRAHVGLKTNAYSTGKRRFKDDIAASLFRVARTRARMQAKDAESGVDALKQSVGART